MKNNLSMFLKVFTLYIGTVIGAGFASGQEILQFFIQYGKQGLLGAAIATALFAYLGMVIMYLSTELHAANYRHVLPFIMGRASIVFDYISILMLVGGLGVMLAGSGAVLNQYLGVPKYIGVALGLAITIIVICGGVNRVLSVNLFLVPIKLLVVCTITVVVLIKGNAASASITIPADNSFAAANWLWASILYVSYNMVVPLAALSTTGRMVSRRIGISAGLCGGLVLGLATLLVTAAGLFYYPEISHYPVPMLYLASSAAPIFKTFFAVLIWVAILTTAIADAHGFASRIAPAGGKLYKISGAGICIAVLPLANIGFVPLVQKLYPAFGFLGLILIAALLIAPVIKIRKII